MTRILYSALFSLIFIPCHAQIPDYFADNPTWLIYQGGGVPETGFTQTHKLVYIEKDTIINGVTYKKLLQTGYFSSGSSWPPPVTNVFDSVFYGLHRQEGRKIMAYNTSNQTESVLISYNYQPGDLIESSFFFPFPIVSIDSLLIGSGYRKQFFLDSTGLEFLLEGIGFFTPDSDMFSAPYGETPIFGIEAFMSVCYAQNELPLFPYDQSGNLCSTQYLELEQSAAPEMHIVVDPEKQVVRIQGTNEPVNLSIRNMLGQLITEVQGTELSTASLKAGAYIVYANTGNHIVSQKIVTGN